MNIGIIGAGMIGGTLGELWHKAGHAVRFGTRNPAALTPLLAKLGQGAGAGSPAEAIAFADVLLFAAPFGAWPEFAQDNAGGLAGKTILDAANPYAQRDGAIVQSVAKFGLGSSAFVAQLVPSSQIVKAFNTVYFAELAAQAHRQGERLGIPIAGDPGPALDLAVRLVSDAGFDPIVIGNLSTGGQLDPGTKVYAKTLTAKQIATLFGLQ